MNHRARKFGKSKYGVKRIIKGFLDLMTVYFLTGFGQRPQHLLGTVGSICFALGLLGLAGLTLWRTVSWIPALGLDPVHLHQKALFYYSIVALLFGGQLMSIGFLAELFTAYYGGGLPAYSIAERTVAPTAETSAPTPAAPHSPTAGWHPPNSSPARGSGALRCCSLPWAPPGSRGACSPCGVKMAARRS